MMDFGSGGGGSSAAAAAVAIGTATCQDCGNQAKKDCSHRRCRTCCKSRGFDCTTHVKSTWVPAARRRERQSASAGGGGGGGGGGASSTSSASKKPRLAAADASHTSNSTHSRSFDTTSSHQDASFKERLPGQVRAPAVFKCVRVTAIDGGDDEYAYQATVRIGGHVFKGFLYDQGFDDGNNDDDNDNNNNTINIPNMSELHLGGASSSGPIVGGGGDVYAASGGGGGLMGGTAYGNPIN
ncbi:hypothetical protein QJS10_CPA05g00792 [Acorus calamus]|uniref:Uncharacterized protein n=1 Tax=Acorus calamus TaxID=4465 RepID=A0AAV9EX58_ACOCL|nr:hypothetical protein QJS10_CPA05g00792 [Acorus calamus]